MAEKSEGECSPPGDAEYESAFPVVGIGASAGGLEALKRFFQAMPADSGMAFVVVQHLDPTHESIMADILGKVTAMKVVQIQENMRVEPNGVYVIRPDKTLGLRGGVLHLSEPAEPRGRRRPVDLFFRALAADQKERAIAIVLSGSGTNGTAGLKNVKEEGGLILVQDPQTAQHDGMPRSAIATGLVDFVLPVEEMPRVLVEYAEHPYVRKAGDEAPEKEETGDRLEAILALLRARQDFDFRCYKKATLVRRIQRRMSIHHIGDTADYLNYLRAHPDELKALAADLMISVTCFFRDPEAWEQLEEHVVRPLVARLNPKEGPLRVWVPGCATGEEAYSLAMLFIEQLQAAQKNPAVQIFGSDMDQRALNVARTGVYPDSIETDLSPVRLRRFFDKEDHHYRVSKQLRDAVVFAVQNVINDPPFGSLDLISCRNLLIFLEPEVQRNILGLFHFALRQGGYLFLGSSETIGSDGELFEMVSKRWRLYRRVGGRRIDKIAFPALAPGRPRGTGPSAETHPPPAGRLNAMVQQLVLERYARACVIVNRHHQILYMFGPTHRYLTQPKGELNSNLMAWLSEGLRTKLRAGLHKVAEKNDAVTVGGIRIKRDDAFHEVSCAIEPLALSKDTADLLLIAFDVQPSESEARYAEAGAGDEVTIRQLEYELRLTQDELKNAIEQLESSNEEFRSSHEEVLSINEELQSTNEELETSKEELQSVNEELTTVNQQLEHKNQELEAAYNDLNKLLSSTDIATLFLDRQFCIRRFTPATTRLMRLIASDGGRSIEDITSRFDGRRLLEDAATVLRTLTPLETEIRTDDGRWYLRRCLPYRTEDSRIDGVVLTFVEITARKAAERRQRFLVDLYDVIRALRDPGAILDAAVRLIGEHYAVDACAYAEVEPARGEAGVVHAYGADAGRDRTAWPLESLGSRLVQAFKRGKPLVIDDTETSSPSMAPPEDTLVGRAGRALLSVPLVRDGNVLALLTLSQRQARSWSAEDVALLEQVADRTWVAVEKARAEEALRLSEERFRIALQNAPIAVFSQDRELRYTWVYKDLFDCEPERVLGRQDRDLLASREDTEAIEAIKRQVLETETTRRQDVVIHTEAGERHYQLTVEPLQDAARRATGITGSLVEITEHIRLQEQLREMDRRKDEFLAMLGHELRNPLQSIRHVVDALKLQPPSEPRLRQSVALIDRQTSQLIHLVGDLLDVARITRGQITLHQQTVNLADCVARAAETVQETIDRRRHRLEVSLPEEPLYLKADPVRLVQVLANLLSNAAKYSTDGGHIWLTAQRQGSEIVIKVRDTGIGISAERLPLLLESPMTEFALQRGFGGLGLGLMLVRNLVEMHGGSVAAASEGLAKGSEFTVRLPVLEEAGEPAQTGRRRVAEAVARQRRVLIVEDNEAVARSLAMLLRALGHEVHTVADGETALEAVQTLRPDIVLLDIGLPGIDGYEVARRLRVDHQATALRMVALTGHGQERDRERTREAGFDQHLIKPVDIEALRALLASLPAS